jgi:membrane-associated HD superfamily phosphohydrolase
MSKAKTVTENNTNEIENISKIRDILFGNNMNEYEKRFEQLEDKLALSIAEGKAETDKRISTLENYLKQEIRQLNDKLTEEEEMRIKSDKKIISDLESLEESLKKFKQSTGDNFSAVNQQIMDLSNTTNEQLTSLRKALQDRLESASNQLQTNKVERSSLAMMLTDLAYKIAGESETEESNN